MRFISIAHTSRGDPLVAICVIALGALTLPSVAYASDDPAAGPAVVITRTATRAVSTPDYPDDTQSEPVAAALALQPSGLFAEPRLMRRGIDFGTRTLGDTTTTKSGFYPEFSNMPTGSGWISIGPGYRQWLYGDRAVIEGSAAYSWRSYKMIQGRFELPTLARSRVVVGSQVMWQDLTQMTYFGEGSNSLESTRSEYRLQSTDLVGYVTVRPRQWLAIGSRFGYLLQPSLSAPAGTFMRGNPSTFLIFANSNLPDQPSYVHTEASITADTRDSRSHPLSGGMYRIAGSVYSDRNVGVHSFRRYEAEGAQFVGVLDNLIVLAAHGWVVATDTDAGQSVPFYMLPSLGGNNTLRAFTDYRFHDRNFALVNLESRLALSAHVDLAAFVDAGNVAARVSDLNLDKRDWGIGVRVHANEATFGRLDVAHGTEGWRFVFRTNDPLHLSHISRRTAAVPFVP
ncbi:MAG TPA: BamA/TamA family outer membrane protein [Rhodanobacteraceae bacterium]